MITEEVRKAALIEQENFLQNMLQQELDLASTFNKPSYCKTKGFRAASRSLLRKRMRTVAKVCPKIRESLGEAYDPLFRKFAKEAKPGPDEIPLVDGLHFSKWLLVQKARLNDEAIMEILAIELHFQLHDAAFLGKFNLQVRKLNQSKKHAVGFSIPFFGTRILVV